MPPRKQPPKPKATGSLDPDPEKDRTYDVEQSASTSVATGRATVSYARVALERVWGGKFNTELPPVTGDVPSTLDSGDSNEEELEAGPRKQVRRFYFAEST